MPMWANRSTASSSTVMPRTGVASTCMIAVAYIAQMLSGIWNQPMPCGRNLWMVTRKLRPVKIDENPSTNTPHTASSTGVFDSRLYGV